MIMGKTREGMFKGIRGTAVGDEQRAMDISSPGFVFTDAASRDDLYALPNRQRSPSTTTRPRTGGGKPENTDMHQNWGLPERPKPKNASNRVQDIPQAGHAVLSDPRLEHIGIGMALGSPSHPPWASHQRRGTDASEISVLASTPADSFVYDEPQTPATMDDSKAKARWKMFGGFFSKKGSHPTTPATPFYSVVNAASPKPPILNPQPERPSFNPEARLFQDWAPQEIESRTSSMEQDNKPPLPRSRTSPPDSLARIPTPPPKDERPSGPSRAITTLPLLQVDIPDVKMERYSIMFGNVLKPRGSLMVRRQAQLERLKVVEDLPSQEISEQELQLPVRRATLPSPGKSPSYTLFPAAQPDRRPSPLSSSVQQQPAPLQRSNTAPASSPGRANFEQSKLKGSNPSKVVFTIDSPSPATDSPETPSNAPWASDISQTSETSDPLEVVEVSPREHENIIIQLEPPPSTIGKLKDSMSMPHLRNDDLPLPPPVRAAKPQNSPTLRSRYNTSPLPVSPFPGRMSSLNKPLPSPHAAIEQEKRAAQEARKASLPATSVRTIEIKNPRKASLPAMSAIPTEIRPRKPSIVATSAPRERQATTFPRPPTHSPQIRSNAQANLASPPTSHPQQMSSSSTLTSPASSTHTLPSSRSALSPNNSPKRPVQDHIQVTKPMHSNPLKSSPASAAEISIARQISISRRQQMMVPIVPKAVKQPNKATLVVPEDSKEETKGHASRKSHHGQLEIA